MTKLNIKKAVGRTSLLKKCHGDIDSRNMNENLIALSFVALNKCLFGITRGALAPQNKK